MRPTVLRCLGLILTVTSLLAACASNQAIPGFRIHLSGSVDGARRNEQVSVAVADEKSGAVISKTMTQGDGHFAFDELRLLPGRYLIAATTRDNKLQGADRLVVPPAAFAQTFVANIRLEKIPLTDIDPGSFPLHFAVQQLFATDRDLTSHAPTAMRGPLVFGRRDIALPIADGLSIIHGKIQPLSEAEFVATLNAAVTPNASRDILLYVHGYNNSFDDAATSLAELQHGTRFKGISLFFSWPSRGRLLAYWTDEREASRSTDDFVRYLHLVLQSRAGKVTVVAHSMGNRVVTEALARIAAERQAPHMGRPFHNIVLAAADIDPDTLSSRIPAILTIADRVTIYFSRADRATAASKAVHNTRVVGHDGIVYASEAVDVIDATHVSDSFLAHSYLEERPVMNDIFDLLNNEKPAAERPLLPFDDFYQIARVCNR